MVLQLTHVQSWSSKFTYPKTNTIS